MVYVEVWRVVKTIMEACGDPLGAADNPHYFTGLPRYRTSFPLLTLLYALTAGKENSTGSIEAVGVY